MTVSLQTATGYWGVQAGMSMEVTDERFCMMFGGEELEFRRETLGAALDAIQIANINGSIKGTKAFISRITRFIEIIQQYAKEQGFRSYTQADSRYDLPMAV